MRSRKKIIFLIIAAAALLLAGCSQKSSKDFEDVFVYDGPPEDFHEDEPEPAVHDGTYVNAAYGSLTFNGDGESIAIDITEAFAELTGLPAGTSEGTYEFRLGTAPTNPPWRYDYAHEFNIIIGDETKYFINMAKDISAENHTDENTIVIVDGEEFVFRKE